MQSMNPKISVLVSARKNSKYLAKFLFGYLTRTSDLKNTELLIMMNKEDTWNEELREASNKLFKFYEEDYGLGRNGLHIYFNDLYKKCTGDWIIYFCEDHFIIMQDWDEYIRKVVSGGSRSMKHKTETREPLDSNEPYCLVPKFDNVGAMNQILSRGYIEALGGVLGRHGWIDSYINDLNKEAFGDFADRVIRMDDEMFTDFSHYEPSPMEDIKPVLKEEAKLLPKYGQKEVLDLIDADAKRLKDAIN